jgi:hypothetical protein
MRLLKGQASDFVALSNVADVQLQKKLDHFWVAESASLVQRIVTKDVCTILLTFNQFWVSRIVVRLAKKHLYYRKLVMLNRNHKWRPQVITVR